MQPVRDWTVLVYMNANNNLANGAKGLLRNQLAALEPCDKVSVAVEYSHLRGEPGYIWPDAATHRRCEVGTRKLETIEQLPYQNMAAPKTLEDFLRWGIERYPAKHYVVVVQGHGSAWRKSLPDDATRFDAKGAELPKSGQVYEGSRPATLGVDEIGSVLDRVARDTGVTPDILAFDSCLMSNLEAACELQDRAGVLVASEDVMWSPMWQRAEHTLDYAVPLKGILQRLSDRLAAGEDVSARTVAADWVDECSRSWTTPTQTALDMQAVPAMTQAADALAEALLGAPEDAVRELTQKVRNFGDKDDRWTKEWDSKRHLYDLVDLAREVEKDPRLQEAHEAARATVQAVEAARVAHVAQDQVQSVWRFSYGSEEPQPARDYDEQRTHGVSIYLPDNPAIQARNREEGSDYDALRFARETRWPKLIQRVVAAPASSPTPAPGAPGSR